MDCLDISIILLVDLKWNHIQRYPISVNLWALFFKDHLFGRERLFRMYMNYVQSASSYLRLFGFFVGRAFLDKIILSCTYTFILPMKKNKRFRARLLCPAKTWRDCVSRESTPCPQKANHGWFVALLNLYSGMKHTGDKIPWSQWETKLPSSCLFIPSCRMFQGKGERS